MLFALTVMVAVLLCKGCLSAYIGCVRITNITSPDFISTNFISSEPSGCEATQFAMATTS